MRIVPRRSPFFTQEQSLSHASGPRTLVAVLAHADDERLAAPIVAMFPANVHAAREGLVIAGRRASPLMWRLPLQLFWIVTLWRVARANAGA